MTISKTRLLAAVAVALFAAAPALALTPYTPFPFGVSAGPFPGPGVPPPGAVPGKEYSHDFDFSVFGPTPDPQQVIAWDGIGGTADAVDYSGTRPAWEVDQEVDAIANSRDTLFDELTFDLAHLVYSIDDEIAAFTPSPFGGSGSHAPVTIPAGGPVVTDAGLPIAGAGDVGIEIAGAFAPPSTFGAWAPQPSVNDMPLPDDVDGLEVWGPEPLGPGDEGFPVVSDADKYSLDVDAESGESVWNLSGTPYISHAMIVDAVTTLLGPIPSTAFSLRDGLEGRDAINLDALMVSDVLGETDTFDEDFDPIGGTAPVFDQSGLPVGAGPNGEPRGDSIVFSIRQIVDPEDADGFYATGSELIVLDSLFGVGFLAHGGHVWDDGYALSDLSFTIPGTIDGDTNGDGKVDLTDLDTLATNFGGMLPGGAAVGDFNGDGKVDLADLDILATNFGGMAMDEIAVLDINAIEAIGGDEQFFDGPGRGGPAGAVPEPTTAVLAVIALGALAAGRRR